MRSYGLYIDGRDVATDRWIHVIRASALLEDAFEVLRLKRQLDRGNISDVDDDRVVGRFAYGTADLCASALEAARRAQPQWARVPFADRLEVLARFHQVLTDRAAEFVDILVAEGHPRRLADWEVAGVIAGSSPRSRDTMAAMMDRTTVVDGRKLHLVRKPDGVVGLHPPRNAAASNSMLGLPALIGGNSLVVKAPRSSPLGVVWAWRELVAPVLEEFGAPPGTLNIVCSDPGPILDQWLDSPLVDDVMFFGDSERGMKFGRQCVERGKKPVLELSGNDGVVIWDDAELELAARALAECFYGSAQICMVPKYAIVHPDVVDELSGYLVKEIARIKAGVPEDPEVLLSPVLKAQDFFGVLDEAVSAGAELIVGGERMDQDGKTDSSGVFVQPTVVRVQGLAAAETMRAVRDETFFPLLPIVVPDTDTDAAMFDASIDFLNGNRYGLRNSLWTRDEARIAEFCARVSNGGLLKVNDSHLGFAQGLPTHGGTGLTGGPFGEANFPILRTTHLQGISIATDVAPREAIFDSAATAMPPAMGS